MASLIIEGDPWEIRTLADELVDRNYLTSDFDYLIWDFDATVAPDLLAACGALLKQVLDDPGLMEHSISDYFDPGSNQMMNAVRRAQAAIAKAKGE